MKMSLLTPELIASRIAEIHKTIVIQGVRACQAEESSTEDIVIKSHIVGMVLALSFLLGMPHEEITAACMGDINRALNGESLKTEYRAGSEVIQVNPLQSRPSQN